MVFVLVLRYSGVPWGGIHEAQHEYNGIEEQVSSSYVPLAEFETKPAPRGRLLW